VIDILIYILRVGQQVLILLVFASVILSFFMDPYHPIRRSVDSVVQPLLNPIRRVVPLVGVLDFSPIILIVLVQIGFNILIRLLISLR
jgi:YggT family protein